MPFVFVGRGNRRQDSLPSKKYEYVCPQLRAWHAYQNVVFVSLGNIDPTSEIQVWPEQCRHRTFPPVSHVTVLSDTFEMSAARYQLLFIGNQRNSGSYSYYRFDGV